VAVGAQAGEAVELGLSGSGDVEGSDVVHFDVTLAQVTIGTGEVADLAPEWTSAASGLLEFQLAELWVPLPREGPADEEAPLDGSGSRVIEFVGLNGEELKLAGADAVLDGLGGLKNLGLALGERTL